MGANTCEQCGNEFVVNSDTRIKRFCSRSCSARYNNLARGKEYWCRECRSPLGLNARLYCSKKCEGEYRRKKTIQDWLDGKVFYTSEYGVPQTIRRYLLELAGNKCSALDCCVPGGWSGVNPKSGKSALTIDHIDGDATNNTPTNLRVLCPNCHSLTPTFGALNIGVGTRRYRHASKA